MSVYLMRFGYTPETWARLMQDPEDRRDAARAGKSRGRGRPRRDRGVSNAAGKECVLQGRGISDPSARQRRRPQLLQGATLVPD